MLLGRLDSDARATLSDSSLSQLNEPDPRARAEDESRCKLAPPQELFLPTSITLREGTTPLTQINILNITQMQPQLVISVE